MSSPVMASCTTTKMNVAHIPTTAVGFTYTSKCTYACRHCSVECGPHRIEKLDADTVAARIDEAKRLGLQGIAFTGGEAMLYADELLPLIRRASALNLSATLISNGFWASTAEEASEVVRKLKDAGTATLEVSCDAMHVEAGMTMLHLTNVVAACRRWRLPLTIASVVLSSISDEDRAILNVLKLHRLDPGVGSVVPYGTARKALPVGKNYYRRRPIDLAQKCSSLGLLNYAADGSLLPCCGQGAHESAKGPLTGHFVLGHINEPLLACLERSRNNLFLLVLAVLGPIGFVILNREYGGIVTLPDELHSTCDMCVLAGRDERFHDLLAEMEKDRGAIIERIYRCHDIINRWGLIKFPLIER